MKMPPPLSLPFWVRLFFFVLVMVATCEARPRLAILPLIYDMELVNDLRQAAGGFDARLQAELLGAFDVELVSRTHMGALSFEQGLRAASVADAAHDTILPADAVVVPVLDFVAKQLRLYIVPVKAGMKVPKPRVVPLRAAKQLNDALVKDAAKEVASEAHLKEHVTMQLAEPGMKALKLALLPPVCSDRLKSVADSQSSLIQATLEHALVTMQTKQLTLVERSHIAALLDEKALSSVSREWSPNSASQLGRMAKADLLLSPFIHRLDYKTVRTDLFAVEVSGGRVVACASYEGASEAPPNEQQITSLLAEGLAKREFTRPQDLEAQVRLRHAEASFLPSLVSEMVNMRTGPASLQPLSVRVADAVVGLASDDPLLLGKLLDQFWWRTVPGLAYPQEAKYNPATRENGDLRERERLKSSGLLPMMYADAREALQRPLAELAKSGDLSAARRQAEFHLRMDEPERALAILTTAGGSLKELAANEQLYSSTAAVLLNLGRYTECADLVFSREKLWEYPWERGVIACRELGDKQREYDALWRWRHFKPTSVDFIVRRLELAVELGRAEEMVNYITSGWSGGATNTSQARLAIVKARLAAKQTELALSDAQGALICERKDKNTRVVAELESLLAEHGVAPIEKLPPARDFFKVPATWCIQLVHDQSIKPAHAKEVAERLADFWGCNVKVWGLQIDPSTLSIHDRFKKTTDADGLLRLFLRAKLPPDPRLGFVYLTNLKCTFKGGQGMFINAAKYYWNLSMDFVSDYYVPIYNPKQPIIPIDAALCGGFSTVGQFLSEEVWQKEHPNSRYQTTDPDAFASLLTFYFKYRSLGVAPQTGKLLAKVNPDELRAYLDRDFSEALQKVRDDRNDNSAVEDISRQFSMLEPQFVPFLKPAAGVESAQR
jgi:hypothetical protein